MQELGGAQSGRADEPESPASTAALAPLSLAARILRFVQLARRGWHSVLLGCTGGLFVAGVMLAALSFGTHRSRSADYETLFATQATVLGVVLAIVFSFLVLAVQNVAGRFSPVFVWVIASHWAWKACGGTLLGAATWSVLLLFLQADAWLALSAILVGLGALLSLPLLAYYTFQLLDPQVMVALYRSQVVRTLRDCLRQHAQEQEEAVRRLESTLGASSAVRTAVGHAPIGDRIVAPVIEGLQPIASATAQAIRQDHGELATAGFATLAAIGAQYLHLRRDYRSDEDSLLQFLVEQLMILSGLAAPSPNQRFLPAVCDAAQVLAVAALEVNTVSSDDGANGLLHGPVGVLERILLSQELFKETSYAAGRAASALGEVAQVALRKGLADCAVSTVGYKLAECGRLCLHFGTPYSIYVARVCAEYLLRSLDASIQSIPFMRTTGAPSAVFRRAAVHAFRIADALLALEKPPETRSYDDPVVVLCDPMASPWDPGPLSIAKVVQRAVWHTWSDQRHGHTALEAVAVTLRQLRYALVTVAASASHLKEFHGKQLATQTFESGFVIGTAIVDPALDYAAEDLSALLAEQVLPAFADATAAAIGTRASSSFLRDAWWRMFGLMGVLIYEWLEQGRYDFSASVRQATEALAETVAHWQTRASTDPDAQLLGQFLRRLALWLARRPEAAPVLVQVCDVVLDLPPWPAPRPPHPMAPPRPDPFSPEVPFPRRGWRVLRPTYANPAYWDAVAGWLQSERTKPVVKSVLRKRKRLRAIRSHPARPG